MDIKITNWIFEYFRQPLEDQALNSQLLSYLHKSFLLNRLDLDLSRRSVSETMLDIMEQLGEIEKRVVSYALKRAYCAVAVDCTLNLLKAGRRQPLVYLKFIEMVKRLWRGRIGSMKKSVENEGLGSEMLWAWKEEIEAAVLDDSLCDSMMNKFNVGKAEEVVGFYLREERDKMVPSFLELVAEKMKNDKWVQEILGETTRRVAPAEVKEILGETTRQVAPAEVKEILGKITCGVAPAEVKEILGKTTRQVAPAEVKEILGKTTCGVAPAEVKEILGKTTRGVAPAEVIKEILGKTTRRVAPAEVKKEILGETSRPAESSPEVDNAREALGWSSAELLEAIKDPLPFPKAIQVPAESNDSILIVDDDETVQPSVPSRLQVKEESSARSDELDESICRAVAPPLQRLKRRAWSILEEETLRNGVSKYGHGNWKVILTSHRDIFLGRTEVNLKDKWRNMPH